MAKRVAILGGGSWGTALALLLGKAGQEVQIWVRDEALVEAFARTHTNERYLPQAALPLSVSMTCKIEQALKGAMCVVWAVPSSAFRETTRLVSPFLTPETLLISATKGLEGETCLRMSQILGEMVPNAEQRAVVLSGPNLAVEIGRGLPTASVAASYNLEAAQEAQSLFLDTQNPIFRVYTGRDVKGVELGGAAKNVIAIGAGVCEGLGYGDNSKAALVTRGLAETIRLGVAIGADPATFLGLSGVGDLFATAGSRLSRNFRVGFALGQGRPIGTILEELGQVAEGVPTTRALVSFAKRSGVEMPLCTALYATLFEGRSAQDSIRELLSRPLKDENY